jgi:VacB/RNase II family 3'-5' exoribonuclease
LFAIAEAAMRERGLDPRFPPAALAEVRALDGPPSANDGEARDLRALLWCSIDNDDSRDLDQLSVAQPGANGAVTLFVAIADVDAAVPKDSPVDRHAALNTTSVYTPGAIFPMLPERLSTDLTSLADHEDRLSVVVQFTVASSGEVSDADLYRARVRNRSKLAYNSVGAWLAGGGPLPPAAAAVAGMDDQLRMQDRAAQNLSRLRHERGALEFETVEVRHVFDGDTLEDVRPEVPNRARTLIENLMVAANGVTARFLDAKGLPSLRRMVRSPERWDRIRALAEAAGDNLPTQPDSKALADFLARRRAASADTFADLSRTVIKLLGSGEYVVDPPGADPPGHFGLAVRDYTHSTAPNRRFPDLVTQRLVKAALSRHTAPYTIGELESLAAHCTKQEDAANKVERQVRKAAAALLVQNRIGERFDAIVTGASPKGTWARVRTPPMEGKLVRGDRGLDVGDHVRVKLVGVDVERGFIDLDRA